MASMITGNNFFYRKIILCNMENILLISYILPLFFKKIENMKNPKIQGIRHPAESVWDPVKNHNKAFCKSANDSSQCDSLEIASKIRF